MYAITYVLPQIHLNGYPHILMHTHTSYINSYIFIQTHSHSRINSLLSEGEEMKKEKGKDVLCAETVSSYVCISEFMIYRFISKMLHIVLFF